MKMREQSDATKLRIIKSDLKRARELNQRLMRELLERRKWGQMMLHKMKSMMPRTDRA